MGTLHLLTGGTAKIRRYLETAPSQLPISPTAVSAAAAAAVILEVHLQITPTMNNEDMWYSMSTTGLCRGCYQSSLFSIKMNTLQPPHGHSDHSSSNSSR